MTPPNKNGGQLALNPRGNPKRDDQVTVLGRQEITSGFLRCQASNSRFVGETGYFEIVLERQGKAATHWETVEIYHGTRREADRRAEDLFCRSPEDIINFEVVPIDPSTYGQSKTDR